ncbi:MULTISPECIES: iron-sulfur cluster assembly accessory protein [Thermoactinomyces]|jgi:iron-sulfur cluster assembly protein|uniref:Iron-sulfur cluster assembly accessory protein n=1 Tax=Thermoactinomyces daqus TaxID=1329516 RepID=A0A7W1X8M5_9BACL|nr:MULTISPECIES: iron-sulfur cluster assembly accessory protein [Thermoactinomyces]MBA4542078.1 iron-sulfur cluster assembly accessory protein [Thermoactinomyces daqus]MBH8598919.1 iron-sulfur cluster assembly accessory protein [Thermoactinomyces sp. CICC 10523]MBH8604905.1 iron-sulfur cluster assembly accessory protein [Thermoactinomyces sp. CICC 10522]MBH8608379.1 iron-sulfur cluster assembly accessory protein [Thermoactinomyces sp. CICC 10521]
MITLTKQAALKVREMLAEQENPEKLYLRVGVQHGGCSGFSYSMGFDEDKHVNDVELEFDGVRTLIDKENEPYLKGTIIDYKESLMGGGFSIENPNAVATCGCGSSFRTATDAGKPSDC